MTSNVVEELDFLANLFEHSDWNYTRQHHMKHIRFDDAHYPSQKFSQRFKIAWRFLTKTEKHGFIYKSSLKWRFIMFFHCIKRDPNLPDGVLDRGNVITFWEETGEYLQMVQPSVGALLANFLKEDPEHPHAKLITAELQRISEGYTQRITSGEVNRQDSSHDA